MGFIQPGADFEMGIKFRPDDTILRRCVPYTLPAAGVIAVPVRVLVPDQVG